jgi:hypothetical protein
MKTTYLHVSDSTFDYPLDEGNNLDYSEKLGRIVQNGQVSLMFKILKGYEQSLGDIAIVLPASTPAWIAGSIASVIEMRRHTQKSLIGCYIQKIVEFEHEGYVEV